MKDLIEVGITKESKNDYIDIFSHRIMIPIFDQYGNPVGFGARVLGDAKPKYINTMATPLFNKSELLFNYHKAKSFILYFVFLNKSHNISSLKSFMYYSSC